VTRFPGVSEAADARVAPVSHPSSGVLGRLAPATALFALAAAASAALLLILGTNLTFLLDEWTFLLERREFELDSLLAPHNEHIVVLPVAVYKTILALFGMESAVPFRVVSTAAFVVSVALLYMWMRRRVGDWLALAGCLLVLFLGAAWEDLLWPFQIGFFGSMSCGIGALLALERETKRGDALACGLLVGAIAFSSLGISFVAGAAAALAVAGVGQRRLPTERVYLVAVPAVLFGLWWLGWGRDADTAISAANIASAPQFVLDGVGASLSALLGLSTPSGAVTVGPLDWGRPLAVAALALAGWRLWRLGTVPRWLWVLLAVALSFWVLAAFNEKEGRDATASRYMYIGGVFCLMIAAELARGVRLRRLGAGAAMVVAVIGAAVISNVYFLDQSATSYERTSDLISADLAAVEIARDHIEPGLILTEDIADTGYVHVYAQSYLDAADDYGSPADTEAKLAEATEPARVAADKVLARALGLTFTPSEEPPQSGGPAPAPLPGSAPVQTRGSCATADLEPDGLPAILELAAGDVVVTTRRGSTAELRLRRYASQTFPITGGELGGGESAVIAIPSDRSQRPWQLSGAGEGRLTVCATAAT
jgi:hypothetical protein